MALRLRRGLDSERQSVIFAEGEPIYTTDTKKIHIGDGSTPGGLLISGLLSLNDDPTPRLGGHLDLNANDIVGIGNLNIVGDISITGAFTAGFIEADYRGSLFANDSSVIVDGNAKALHGSLKADTGETMFDASLASFNLGNNKLVDLGDVVAATTVGEFLTWDGVGWEAKPFGMQLDGNPPPNFGLAQYQDSTGWTSNTTISDASSDIMLDTSTGYVNITKQFINELANVAIDDTALSPDDILSWDGVNWTHKQLTLSNFNINLGELDDVSVSGIDFNHVIKWDGTTWVNDKLELGELKNVAITPANPEETIIWDGVNWVNSKFTLAQLDNVEASSPNIGETLVWSGTDWESDSLSLTSLSDIAIDPSTLNVKDLLGYDGAEWAPTTLSVTDLSDTFISSLTTNDIMIYDGFNWVNDNISRITGALNNGIWYGSLVSNDSSVMVDGDTNSIFAQNITTYDLTIDGDIYSSTNRVSFIGPTSNKVTFQVEADDTVTYKGIRHYTSTPNASDTNGRILFGENVNGTEKSTTLMLAKNDGFLIAFDQAGAFPASSFLSLRYENGDCKVGIGTTTPTTNLDVQGSISNTSFVQFGQLTTIERDIIAAQSGMVIYNTDVNKFQGYAVNAWVDLS